MEVKGGIGVKCVFCDRECKGKYHTDCFDREVWEVFKINHGLLYLSSEGHDLMHLEEECRECQKPKERGKIFELVKSGVNEGKRHIARFIIISNLLRLNYERKKIEEFIWEFNNNCKPPEDKRIVRYHLNYLFRRFGNGY